MADLLPSSLLFPSLLDHRLLTSDDLSLSTIIIIARNLHHRRQPSISDDTTFHLYKFPLMSKSRRLNQLIQEQESELEAANSPYEDDDENDDEIQPLDFHTMLEDFPGGCKTLEVGGRSSDMVSKSSFLALRWPLPSPPS